MDALLQKQQEVVDQLESRTLQLSLAPETPPAVFLLPPKLAYTLLLHTTKTYTIGVILGAFQTYILNNSLAGSGSSAGAGPVLNLNAPIAAAVGTTPTQHSYSAAVALLCRQLILKV
jgi:hypothetical protein